MSESSAARILESNSLLTDRVRLAIIVTLSKTQGEVEFSSLLRDLGLTKGNLSSHVKKLEEGLLITVNKKFVNRKPKTTYEITQAGRQELSNYLMELKELVGI